jgi:hypothetical protein
VNRRGRGWAYVGLLIGGALSVYGNVRFVMLTANGHALADLLVWAVAWPVTVLVAVEILARVPWRRTVWHALARLLLGGVATVAAVESFHALRGLLLTLERSELTATLAPLAIDGLMVTSTVALLLTVSQDIERDMEHGRTLAQRVQDIRTSVQDIATAVRGTADVPPVPPLDVPPVPPPDVPPVPPPDVPPVPPPDVPHRPRGTRPPVAIWDMGKATNLIRTGGMSDRAIAREVFGPDASDKDRKRVERLRTSLNGSVPG